MADKPVMANLACLKAPQLDHPATVNFFNDMADINLVDTVHRVWHTIYQTTS